MMSTDSSDTIDVFLSNKPR